jgi:hypothetical protein
MDQFLGSRPCEDSYHHFTEGPNTDNFVIIFAHPMLSLGWVVGLGLAKGRPAITAGLVVLLGLVTSAVFHGIHDFLVVPRGSYTVSLHVCLILFLWIAYIVVGVVFERRDAFPAG